ncbi:MAG: (deoxy)nucleoside triphosphate pyrophosphohydrolase [Thalassotalea sp.]|nr:(deoxy)nucleoside triphosphate pyrophosphohydrolase [Thalassotalea sp.]
MKTVEVVAAIIKNNNQILCTQRGESKLAYISKKWEFPGGKVEKNESLKAALQREIMEELHMHVDVMEHVITVNHEYPDFKIIMHSFFCTTNTRNLTLTEHLEAKWLNLEELPSLDWAAADIPIVDKLIN